ncbi:MAG: cytochrome C [Bacteroidetes bacterium]|nr:MAG: cytochrome C [Bacteroidota bacterium]
MKRNYTIIPVFVLFSLLFTFNLNGQNTAPAEWATCGACHTIGKGKVVGPDLKGITEKRDEAWLISFIRSSQTMVKAGDAEAVKIFDEFKIPMPDNNFTDEQIKGILTYIKDYKEAPKAEPKEEKAVETSQADGHEDDATVETHDVTYGTGNTRTVFIVFLLLFFFSLIDLGFTKIIKAKFIHYIIILTALFIIGEIVYVEAAALGRQQGYSPDQPIWFSHKVHAGQNKIECEYCHTTAYESRHAGIPSTAVCMNCHNVVKTGAVTGEVEIKKLLDSWENKQAIEWVQVHNMPDHVYFNHAQHVNAGKCECEECHGLVEEMDRVAQVEDLSMGWCLDCHRTTMVQFEENNYYDSFLELHEKLKSGEKGVITVEDIGGTDCSACHY